MPIKTGSQAEYNDFLKSNKSIAGAVKAVVKSLNNGMTPMQVEDALHDFDLTARQTGEIASAVTKLHERGAEFRRYWNKRNGVADNTGLADPQELTFKHDIKKRKAPSVKL